jgi:histidine ammonia-lyase
MKKIMIGADGMTLEDLIAIARYGYGINLKEDSRQRILESRRLVNRWVTENRTVYGITTGFGALSDTAIPREDTQRLQQNVLLSHAAGVGPILDLESVRGVMALRIKDLARGNSGIRLETVEHLVELLNRNVCPVVPEKGSVGASGDLIPLAHLGVVLIGLGEAFVEGERMSGAEALRKCWLNPIELEAGEGLALVNGTQVMTAIGGLAIYDSLRLSKIADIAAAMSLEVLMGSRTEFSQRIHKLRPHAGQAASADNMERITRNSEIISSHKDCTRIQDAYTLRCSPQVHGATKDAMAYVRKVIETEINSSTGNPLIFPETQDFLLGGNFHGQPVALALDFLTMAISEIGNISERRVERLVNPFLSGLPAFLVSDGGLNSGFMIAQYTAAALVSENKILSHPACVDSIPTSANKEDHVSMGTISARKCREVVKNTEHISAIELLCAAQALDLFTNMKPGDGTLEAYRVIRESVPHLEKDRILSPDIEKVLGLIKKGTLLDAVESRIGVLS